MIYVVDKEVIRFESIDQLSLEHVFSSKKTMEGIKLLVDSIKENPSTVVAVLPHDRVIVVSSENLEDNELFEIAEKTLRPSKADHEKIATLLYELEKSNPIAKQNRKDLIGESSLDSIRNKLQRKQNRKIFR